MKFDEKSRIAVVVGGPSTEAAISLRHIGIRTKTISTAIERITD